MESRSGPAAPPAELSWATAVLDALADPVLLIDRDLLVTGMNAAAVTLLDRSSDDLVGQSITGVLAAADDELLGRTRDAVREGVVWECPVNLLAADGKRIPVRLRGAPLRPAGQLEGAVLTLTRRSTPSAVRTLDLELTRELSEALHDDQIVVHYQPIVRLEDRTPVAAEALVRWEHPTRGLLWPADFLETADTATLAGPLGLRVLRQACHAAAAWSSTLRHGQDVQVAVNLSERQLLQPGTAGVVREALTVADCLPQRLLLEVSERALVRDPEAALSALQAIKDVGVGIAIDDLGTGSSPLSYLKRFPVDMVKVDRELIAGLGNDREQTAVVASLVSLSQAMGVRCVAEGVETADQLNVLRQLGCELGQGFLFTRPLTTEAAADWLVRALAPAPKTPARRRAAVDPAAIRRVLELQSEGASLHTVAARLNAEGHRGAGGRRWHHTSVAQVIAAHRYPDLRV